MKCFIFDTGKSICAWLSDEMQHRRVGDVVIGILLPPGVQQVQTNSQNQIWRENLIEAAKKYLFGELRVILGALWDNIAA